MSRRVMLVTHPTRPDAVELARTLGERLAAHGIGVEIVPEGEPTRVVATDGASTLPVGLSLIHI